MQEVIFSQDSRYLASSDVDGLVRLVEVISGREIARIRHKACPGTKYGPVPCMNFHFSPDSRFLVTYAENNVAILTETSSGEEIARIQHQGKVSEVIFSPDGRYLATRSNDGTATLVEVSTGREVARIRHEGDVSQVAFSPDGRYLATAGGNDVYVLPLDIEELFACVCARLPRNLTLAEWQQYVGPEVPYHPTCPNLPVPEE